MPRISLKERTARLASYNFFTILINIKNTSVSQLYQPPRTPFSQNVYHLLLSTCEYCKVLKNSFFIEHTRSSRLQVFFKIGALKSFANFIGKHLCWSLFLKNLQGEVLQLYWKKTPAQVFSCEVLAKLLRTPFYTEHLRWFLLHLR